MAPRYFLMIAVLLETQLLPSDVRKVSKEEGSMRAFSAVRKEEPLLERDLWDEDTRLPYNEERSLVIKDPSLLFIVRTFFDDRSRPPTGRKTDP